MIPHCLLCLKEDRELINLRLNVEVECQVLGNKPQLLDVPENQV